MLLPRHSHPPMRFKTCKKSRLGQFCLKGEEKKQNLWRGRPHWQSIVAQISADGREERPCRKDTDVISVIRQNVCTQTSAKEMVSVFFVTDEILRVLVSCTFCIFRAFV